MARPRRDDHGSGWMLFVAPLVALLAASGTLALDRENGLLSLMILREQVETTEDRVLDLKAERLQLGEQARRLRHDPLEIETVARGVLGMVRPDEIVVRLDEARKERDAPTKSGTPANSATATGRQ